MPRIYAPNEDYNNDWAGVPAFNGVVVLPADVDASWFVANGFTVDNSKHVLTVLDELSPVQLRRLCVYLGIAIDLGEDPDTKHALIRSIEGEISSKYLAEVTVASEAGTEAGDTKITITGEGTYKYMTAKDTAPTAYYLDDVSDWTDIETGDEFTPTATHNKITVAKVNAKGYVLGLGSANITVNPGT